MKTRKAAARLFINLFCKLTTDGPCRQTSGPLFYLTTVVFRFLVLVCRMLIPWRADEKWKPICAKKMAGVNDSEGINRTTLGHRLSFPGVQRPGRGVGHPPRSSAEVKERVELYLYSFGLLWSVPGWTLPFCSFCKEVMCNPQPVWLKVYGPRLFSITFNVVMPS